MKSKLLGISMLTVTCLYGMLAAIIILVVKLLGGEILFGITVGILVLVIQFLISPWLTDLSMRLFYKANFNAELPEYLKSFLFDECKKYNMKNPRVGVIDDGGPNAFTYGRTKNDARIVITRGLYDLLTEEEVKAVVAHELGHVVHYDMLFMTAVQIVPLVLYAIYEAFARGNSSSNNDDNKAAIIGWIAYILYLISQYIILWLSRTREYYADEFSLEETKNPNSLASALVKIGFGLSTADTKGKHNINKKNALGIFDSTTSKSLVVSCTDENSQVSQEHIKNAMKWEMWNPWALWFQLNSTHPLISKRLLAISKRSEEFGQRPYIVFDLEKPESYVDDFFVELLIKFLPTICILLTIVAAFVLREKMMIAIGVGLLLTVATAYIGFDRAHKNANYTETTVRDLLGEVKVSHITSIPCILKGTIIGRGNPGCIFNEDFIVKDSTGIIFLDYNQPLNILNKIFAIFKSKEYFDKEVTVKGWYRRSPVPYVEIKEYTVDGKTKKIWTYSLGKAMYYVFGAIAIGIILFSII